MSQHSSPDHDQRLKVLLKEFFHAFFSAFFPHWADRFDFHNVEWLDKELFLAPPQGDRRQLDLVARLRLRPDVPPPCEAATDLVALVHIEIESRPSAPAFRPRMFDYYVQLRRDTGLPVLPVALFLRLGLKGIGWDAYEEHFWEQRVLRFEYAYVGLPELPGEEYATGENLLGVALSALMRQPAERRAELHAEALKRIASSGENDYRRFLLAECLEAYAELDERERKRLEALLHAEVYREVEPLMKTTYERGIEQGIERGIERGIEQGIERGIEQGIEQGIERGIERGIEQGIERGIEQGERRSALRLLEVKFGPLTPEVRRRVEALPPEAVSLLLIDILEAQSLAELDLED